MTSYRRTRSAILDGTKKLISDVGLQRANMIDIADISEVSRATLYNHFRDKASVLRAVLENEIERLLLTIDSEVAPKDALRTIGQEISRDGALAKMRESDPGVLTQLLTHQDDNLWILIDVQLNRLLKEENLAMIARLWLVAQVLQPLTEIQVKEQSDLLFSMSHGEARL